MIPAADFAGLIPHAGAMRLLSAVEAWDATSIRCLATGHRQVDHPLRQDGRLAAIHAIEYAAQAAAVHGGLLAGGGPAPLRYLGAVRAARFARAWLDDLAGPIWIEADCVLQDGQAVIYQSRLGHDGAEVAAMRLTLVTVAAGDGAAP